MLPAKNANESILVLTNNPIRR